MSVDSLCATALIFGASLPCSSFHPPWAWPQTGYGASFGLGLLPGLCLLFGLCLLWACAFHFGLCLLLGLYLPSPQCFVLLFHRLIQQTVRSLSQAASSYSAELSHGALRKPFRSPDREYAQDSMSHPMENQEDRGEHFPNGVTAV